MEPERDNQFTESADEFGESVDEFLNKDESGEDENIQRSAQEESEEEYEPNQKRQRPPAHDRIQEIQREKYQALNELQRMRQENDELKRLTKDLDRRVKDSIDVAGVFHNKSAQLQLDHAKAKKRKAMEDGDYDALVDADVEMAEAASVLQQAKTEEARRSLEERARKEEEEYRLQQPQAPQGPDPEISNDWLRNNANWFHPQGENYSKEMVDEAQNFSHQLENYYYRNGRPDLICSHDYFRELDNHLVKFYEQSTRTQQRGELVMNPSRSNVAPVRSGGNGQQGSKKPDFTRREAELIKAWGIKPEDYAFHRDKEMRDSPYKRGGQGGGGRYGYGR